VSLLNVTRPDAGQVPVAVPSLGRTARATVIVKAYVALTKPRIVELLLITAVPTLFLAYHGLPSLLVTTVVVLGGALAAGSANALNCYIDRDIDEVMRRTRGRPLVKATVSPRAALIFGLVIGVISVVAFAVVTNLLAAALTLGAIVYYVVVYTLLLKRRTSQSTLWGGVCGSAPVLIAWAAATGTLSLAAVLLFLVVFFWQPPHFWALAIKYKDDYGGRHRQASARRDRGAQLAHGGRLGRVVAGGHGTGVRGERGAARRGFPVRGAQPVRPGPPGRRDPHDAAVPRLDHLPDPALPCRRRGLTNSLT
jgi:hypothetical protein